MGTPPTETHAAVGASACECPSRPQGNPPNGTRPRIASTATHQLATQNAHPGKRMSRAAPAPNRAVNAADWATTSNHASGPMTRSHGVSSPKKTKPKTAPNNAPRHIERPVRVPSSSAARNAATAIGASHQRSKGGKASTRTPPAAPDMRLAAQ